MIWIKRAATNGNGGRQYVALRERYSGERDHYIDTMALPRPQRDWALFLDFDGSIVEIAATPQQIEVDSALSGLLVRVREALGGALAVVSGRPLAQLDSYLGDEFAAAGLHGLERRRVDGRVVRQDRLPGLDSVLEGLRACAAVCPGVFVEDKELSMALHYRQAPQYGETCRSAAKAAAQTAGPEFEVLEGNMVAEVKPRGTDKGMAIEAFLSEPPFAGRTPVFCGDDVTDEHGFQAVNERRGVSVKVGNQSPTVAQWRAASVDEVVAWLATISSRSSGHGVAGDI